MNITIDTEAHYDVTGIDIPSVNGRQVTQRISPRLTLTGTEVIERALAAEEHIRGLEKALHNLLNLPAVPPQKGGAL